MNYLPVNVYTNNAFSDSSNGGVTARMPERLVVPCEDGHISEEDVEKRGYTVLEPGVILNTLHVKPRGLKGHSMFGGNFIYTSDSRFGKAYGRHPIAVHDRQER